MTRVAGTRGAPEVGRDGENTARTAQRHRTHPGIRRPRAGTLAPLAWRPVAAIACGVAAALTLAASHYGYYGDELYFLAAGARLDWGYADQPPLLPLLAHGTNDLFHGSLPGLRLPAIVLTSAGVLVGALIARELGGRAWAQSLAAAAYAVSPRTIVTGGLLVTQTLDAFAWAVATLLLVRWVRARDDRLLVWLGLVTALALQVKYLIVVFWAACAAGLILAGPRGLLRRPRLWVGAALATALTLPTLAWQVGHGWPQLAMARVVPDEVGGSAGGRLAFLPLTLLTAGIVVGAPLAGYGLWRLLRAPELRAYRFLGLACLGVLGLFLATGARYYYAAGLFPLCWACAAVELQERRPAPWWRWVPRWPAWMVSVLLVLGPLLSPPPWTASVDPVAKGSAGWPELAATVAAVHRTLPAESRRAAVVVTDHYWQASALDRFGPRQGLPRSYSPHRGYWYFGQPPEAAGTVLFVGDDPGLLRAHFRDVHRATVSPGGTGFPAINRQVPVWVCAGRDSPWSVIWAELRRP